MKPSKQLIKTLNQANSAIILITVFFLPIFFNPFSANLFVLSKTIFLGIAAATAVIIWMIKNILTKSFRVTLSPFTLPLFLLVIITLVSSIGSFAQFLEGFVSTTSLPIFLFLLFLVATTTKTTTNFSKHILTTLVASGVILSITAILETINLGPGRWLTTIFPNLPQNTQVFLSPAGSAVILLAFVIPTLIISLLLAVDSKSFAEKTIFFATSALMTAALVIASFTILPGKPNAPIFAPFSTSWTVAAENIKNPRAFLLGVGPNNYIQAFSLNKGVEFNQLEIWNTRFNVARNEALYIFTSLGLLGFAAWVLLYLAVIRTARKSPQLSHPARIALIGIVVIFIITLVIPTNIVLQATLVFLLAALASELKAHKSPGTSELMLKFFAVKKVDSKDYAFKEETPLLKTEILPLIIGIPTILACLALFFGAYRVTAADIKFRQSLEAASQNNGTQTYNHQKDAVTLNPFMSSYHRAYANTNLAIATSISAQGNLSDQDRTNITQLIQQSIREARTAAIINPRDPVNWETLAGIYRQLINVADGALDWSTASYTEAIRRDPTNPRIRIELGGIFYQLGDYNTAVRIFEQAVNLKPDWANAYYNLANAYRENGELQRAVAAYDSVLALVDPSSTDFTTAQAEQNQIKAQLGEAAETTPPQPSELQTPAPLPTPLPDNQHIELPAEEAAPPTPQETGDNTGGSGFDDITPTPTPTEQPAQKPTIHTHQNPQNHLRVF